MRTRILPVWRCPRPAAAMLFALALAMTAAQAQNPTIDSIIGPITLDGAVSANLRVEGVSSRGSSVIATITQPESAGNREIDLIFLGKVGDGAFEVVYDGFFYPGVYEVSIVASVHPEGFGPFSEPVATQVTQLAEEVLPDKFEPDDSMKEGTWLGINVGLSAHNFFDEGDEDWVLFFADDFFNGNKPHRNEVDIETRNLDPGVDTKIEVFLLDPSNPEDPLILVAENDNRAEGDPASFLEFFVHETGEGFYAVRVTNQSKNFGPETRYDVRVWREQGALLAGAIFGNITDAGTLEPLSNAHVAVTDVLALNSETGGYESIGALWEGFRSAEVLATEDGVYVFSALAPGFRYALEAWAEGYVRSEAAMAAVIGGEFTLSNFALTSLGDALESTAQSLFDDLEDGDANGSGGLDFDEAGAVLEGLTPEDFDKLDSNGDLELTRNELEGAGAKEFVKATGCHAGGSSSSRRAGDLLLVMLLLAALSLTGRTARRA